MINIKSGLRFFILLVLPALAGQLAEAYTPLLSRNGNLVRWDLKESPVNQPNIIEGRVEFFINRLGTPDLEDAGDGTGGEFDIIRRAFGVWNHNPTSLMRFNDLKLTDQSWGTGSDETNLVIFDETNKSGLFPPGSGIIAMTMTTYEDELYGGVLDGHLRDTDLILNGKDFTFSSGLEPEKINLLSIVVHEIGHVCGLDHSFHQKINPQDDSVDVPSLFPYLNFADDQLSQPDQDDFSGLTELYPDKDFNDQINGSLAGMVMIDGEPAAGIDVVAYQNRRPVVSTFSRSNGSFHIHGVPPGTYLIRTNILSRANISLVQDITTEVHSQYFGTAGNAGIAQDASPVTVLAGKKRANVLLNLRRLAQPDFLEPNDTPQQALLLPVDGTQVLQQPWKTGDPEWMKFQASKGRIYEILTDTLGFFANPKLDLFDSDATTLLASHDNIDISKMNYAARIRFTAQRNGSFYIRLTDVKSALSPGSSCEVSVREAGPARLDGNGDGMIDSMDLFSFSTHWTPVVGNQEFIKDGISTLPTTDLIELLGVLAGK